MPRRYQFQHVNPTQGMRPSAIRLDRALAAGGYEGLTIDWGRHGSNKRLQLERMRQAGVPCPREVTLLETPVVGRTDHHRAGSGFWLCRSEGECHEARRLGATHFMEYVANAREFRVHVAFGKSIKLTEKIHASRWDDTSPVRSHAHGWHQMTPQPNAHKVSLRRYAKQAVEAVGLQWGAVDILMREGPTGPEFFALEVNSAPCLTDPNTDTCERYAQAFTNAAASAATSNHAREGES